MRIACYNFLGGGSARRAAHWERLRALKADVILTQESRPPPDGPRFATALWTEACRGWGTGLFAPRLRFVPIDVRGFRGWVVGGEVERTGRPLRIFSVHCPFGDGGYVKTMHVLLDRLQLFARDGDLVLGGDFNVACGLRGPDELVKMSKAERALLVRMGDELGLLACWQAKNPGVPLVQTLRWTGNRAAPYHCDGIFVPKSWAPRLRSCEVLSGAAWEALSDHNPVVAEVRAR